MLLPTCCLVTEVVLLVDFERDEREPPNQPEPVDLTEPCDSRLSAGSSSSNPAMLSGDGAPLPVASTSSKPVMLLRLAANDCDSIPTGCNRCDIKRCTVRVHPELRRCYLKKPQKNKASGFQGTDLVIAKPPVFRSRVRGRGRATRYTRPRHRLGLHRVVRAGDVDVRAPGARGVGAAGGGGHRAMSNGQWAMGDGRWD